MTATRNYRNNSLCLYESRRGRRKPTPSFLPQSTSCFTTRPSAHHSTIPVSDAATTTWDDTTQGNDTYECSVSPKSGPHKEIEWRTDSLIPIPENIPLLSEHPRPGISSTVVSEQSPRKTGIRFAPSPRKSQAYHAIATPEQRDMSRSTPCSSQTTATAPPPKRCSSTTSSCVHEDDDPFTIPSAERLSTYPLTSPTLRDVSGELGLVEQSFTYGTFPRPAIADLYQEPRDREHKFWNWRNVFALCALVASLALCCVSLPLGRWLARRRAKWSHGPEDMGQGGIWCRRNGWHAVLGLEMVFIVPGFVVFSLLLLEAARETRYAGRRGRRGTGREGARRIVDAEGGTGEFVDLGRRMRLISLGLSCVAAVLALLNVWHGACRVDPAAAATAA